MFAKIIREMSAKQTFDLKEIKPAFLRCEGCLVISSFQLRNTFEEIFNDIFPIFSVFPFGQFTNNSGEDQKNLHISCDITGRELTQVVFENDTRIICTLWTIRKRQRSIRHASNTRATLSYVYRD